MEQEHKGRGDNIGGDKNIFYKGFDLNNKIALIVLGLLIIIGVGFFYYYINQKNKKELLANEIIRERLYIKKIKFEGYSGRLGATFLIPSDWDIWIDPDFASMDKTLLHPRNPEIGVQYFDCYLGLDENEERKDITEIAEEEAKSLSEENYKIISQTFFKRESLNCGEDCEYYKIKYQKINERGVEKIVTKIGTEVNGFEYVVTVFAPENLYPEYEELFSKILKSVKINCKAQENW